MSKESEQIALIFKTCKALTEMETRGGNLHEVEPKKIRVSIEEYDSEFLLTSIHYEFADGKTVEAGNASGGMGKTLSEALTSNLWALGFELEERIAKLQASLVEVKEAAPTTKK